MSRYFAKKTECKLGHKHASAREAKRCFDLHMLQATGEIANLKVEPQFFFVIEGRELKHANGRRAGYKPDFSYTEKGQQVAEDVKASNGYQDRDFALRAALFRHLNPDITLRVS